jgi:hypothetical protein
MDVWAVVNGEWPVLSFICQFYLEILFEGQLSVLVFASGV